MSTTRKTNPGTCETCGERHPVVTHAADCEWRLGLDNAECICGDNVMGPGGYVSVALDCIGEHEGADFEDWRTCETTDFDRSERRTAAHQRTMIEAVTAVLTKVEAVGIEGLQHDLLAAELARADAPQLFASSSWRPEWASAFVIEEGAGTLWWYTTGSEHARFGPGGLSGRRP